MAGFRSHGPPAASHFLHHHLPGVHAACWCWRWLNREQIHAICTRSLWRKVVHCTLPWHWLHGSPCGRHISALRYLVPWYGSKSHPRLLSPSASQRFCRNQPLLSVEQEHKNYALTFKQHSSRLFPLEIPDSKSAIPYAFRENSSQIRKVAHVIVCSSGFTHYISKPEKLLIWKALQQIRFPQKLGPKFNKPFSTLTISYFSLASNGTYIQIRVSGWKHYPVWCHLFQALRHCKQGSTGTCLRHSHCISNHFQETPWCIIAKCYENLQGITIVINSLQQLLL